MGQESSRPPHRLDDSPEDLSALHSPLHTSAPNAQHVVYSVSNWLSGLPDSQAPMPSPKNARETSIQKTPETSAVDLAPQLAKKRSQDFKSKIDGWNETGAGIAREQDEVDLLDEPNQHAQLRTVASDEVAEVADVNAAAVRAPDREGNIPTRTPATPRTPATGNDKPDEKSGSRKGSRNVDAEKKAWVRRKSKPSADGTPDATPNNTTKPLPAAKPNPSPLGKTKISPVGKAKPSPAPKPKGSQDAKPKTASAAKPKVSPDGQPEDVTEVKRAVTPKKRVVSDSHWRKDQTPKKEGESPEIDKEPAKTKAITPRDTTPKETTPKETTPKPRIVRRSVVSLGLKVPPSVLDFKNEEEPAPVKVRPLRRRSRSRSTSRERDSGKEATPDYESSGVKVYIKRRRKSKPSDQVANDRKAFNKSESSLTAPSTDKPSSATDITTPDITPTKRPAPRPSTEPKVERLVRSAEDLGARDRLTRPPREDGVPPRRTSRPSIERSGRERDERSQLPKPTDAKKSPPGSFKIPANKPPRPVPKVFGNRIEGWLAETTNDPFVEPSEPTPAPENVSTSRKASRGAPDTRSGGEGDLRRSSARSRDLGEETRPTAQDESGETANPTRLRDWLDGATPTLKRNGARRGTNTTSKDRGVRRSSPESDDPPYSTNSTRRSSKRNTYGELHDRPFHSTGNRLSTIASVSTLNSRAIPHGPRAPSGNSERRSSLADASVLSRASDGDEPARNSTVLRRKLTKHTDLMSILSFSRDDDDMIKPIRSTRTRRPKNDNNATVGDLMNDVTTDELKYQRELRTLVDGVIPVLLQYVLSQDTSPRNTGSRQSSAQADPALTQPIVEMGVALERLKAAHKRIPMHDPNELLLWAQSSAKVYSDYMRAWRLGFNDIVVNLAPVEEAKKDRSTAWDDGLQRDDHGDLLDGDGERVDVAYLLKRPLVRIKSLSRTLKGIIETQPSVLAEDMVAAYQELVLQARQRANDEHARLEDEAAAAIDPRRARDLRSLAPLAGVHIDPTRRVRARDFFDLELFHSTGQQIGCRIEVIIRDDAPDRGSCSDLLFCEVSPSSRYLLFPPVLVSNVSARTGDRDGELIVMVRGSISHDSEWRELMSLQSNEEQVSEWLDMLGSKPVPPRLTRQSSFNALRSSFSPQERAITIAESEFPLGEQAWPNATKWDGSDVNSVSNDPLPSRVHRTKAVRHWSTPSAPLAKDTSWSSRLDSGKEITCHLEEPRYHHQQNDNQRPARNYARSTSEQTVSGRADAKHDHSVWSPSEDRGVFEHSSGEEDGHLPRRPTMRRRTSSVPSMELPTVHKLRKAFEPDVNTKQQDRRTTEPVRTAKFNEPTSAPAKLQKRPPNAPKEESKRETNQDAQAKTSSRGIGFPAIPSFTPAFLKRHRRTSSPLKHEYEPSTASESPSVSDFSDVDDNQSVTSESSADEGVSTLGPLQNFTKLDNVRATHHPLPLRPSYSTGSDTVAPSDSASQAPYRTVPPTNSVLTKSVANIFSWSDRGSWENMHPEECEIVVTPGLIEAFDLAQAHGVATMPSAVKDASPSARGVKPLVALELTPWVPLRRGTALDISIRSPPTSNSLLRNGSNIMFRSRSPEECESLYNLINRARIDNPTWRALQDARPVKTSNWAEVMDRNNANRSDANNTSWFKSLSRKGSTYRSKGARSASVAGSQSSLGTLNSTFSALRQFSGSSSRIFNIAKSTITSKQSTRSSYSDSLSSGAATPHPIDPGMGTPVGVTNAKVRLYQRETTTKWRDLGNARLTIMLPPRPHHSISTDSRIPGAEKRVLVCGKTGNALLDVTLGENCFERVARTGIAVSVWEEGVGSNGELGHAAATGGVVSSRSTVYMIQMKSERDAAFTFSMVGKLRY